MDQTIDQQTTELAQWTQAFDKVERKAKDEKAIAQKHEQQNAVVNIDAPLPDQGVPQPQAGQPAEVQLVTQ